MCGYITCVFSVFTNLVAIVLFVYDLKYITLLLLKIPFEIGNICRDYIVVYLF